MLRAKLGHCAKILDPAFIALSRDCKHQIYINIRKTRLPCHVIAFQKLLIIMDPAKCAQFLVFGRLQANADPINPISAVKRKLLRRQSSRIRLNSNLRICCQLKIFPNSLQKFFHNATLRHRGCPSADKNGIHRTLFYS